MIDIRPALASDADQIVALWNDVIDRTTITFTTQHKTPEGIAADIAQRGPLFQVAARGDVMLGFATAFAFRSGPGYARTLEHSIQLTPEARGHGLGRGLMTALESAAQQQGAHSLFAGCSAENPGAVDFHRAIGYAEVARLPQVGFKFGRWIDLVLLQKFLGNLT